MAKSLKDIIGPRAGRNVSKDEEDILDALKVDKKEDPAGNKDDVFNATNVPAEASSQKADPGMRHGYRSVKAASAAYEETSMKNGEKKKKPLSSEDDRNINAKDYGYGAGAKGNGSAVSEEIVDEGMSASTIKQKQKLSYMSPDELHSHFKSVLKANPQHNSVENAARSSAWSHGYGKNSGHYWNQIKHLETKNEEVELDEAKKDFVIKHKKTRQVLSTHTNYNDAKDEHSGISDKHNYSIVKQTKKDAALAHRNIGTAMREDIEELDEISNRAKSAYLGSAVADLASQAQYHGRAVGSKDKKHDYEATGRAIRNRQIGIHRATKSMRKEDIEETNLDEVLSSASPMKKWIKDFVKSKNPKFAGKSAEKRRQMAIAAKYSAERGE